MFTGFSKYQPQLLSVLRIVTGLLFVCHGTAKVLGFPAVEGVPPPGLSLAGLSGPLELVLGTLFLIGLFTRPVAFLASGFCAVGYWMIHAPQGPFPIANGGETIALYCFVFLYFVASGAGPLSVDAVMKRR
ncbi:DoxX family protein [Brevundimonas lenta]|uniref:Putative oxidoreductase n=1 Tax=Brevundimonas lenta TaxID=424796 RepID=A0A7W6JD59_9CAUL|nr:DoxX family protein [Brevundimonas lenta]MBB4082949.1 putative oxidoreductase [Brevundimonas lenta]